jgi:hypothetical protein
VVLHAKRKPDHTVRLYRGAIPDRGKVFLFLRPVLGPTQFPMQWVPVDSFPGVKNGEAIPPVPPSPTWLNAYLIKHSANLPLSVTALYNDEQ